jgi:hypothetical protein
MRFLIDSYYKLSVQENLLFLCQIYYVKKLEIIRKDSSVLKCLFN